MIDAHCHLTYPGLREKVKQVINESKRSLRAVITCGFPIEEGEGSFERGFDLSSAELALKLARKNSNFVYVTMGLHPVHAVRMSDKEVEEYIEFIKEHKDEIVGIGEIGLDRHWIKTREGEERSREVFIQMLSLAEEVGKPVVLHLRKSEDIGVKIVLNSTNLRKVLLHSFSGNMTTAKEALESGFCFSLNPKLSTIKNAKKIAKRFPLNVILTETDAPFLSPTDDPVNKPVNVIYVVKDIARIRGVSVEEVDKVTTENAVRFFSLS